MPLQNLNNTSANHSAEYLISGIPFFESGTAGALPGGTCIPFDHVTQRVKIVNDGVTDLIVAATQNGLTGSRNFTIPMSGSIEMPWRVARIYVAGGGGYQVVASLTTVRSDHASACVLSELSASNGWDGIG